MKTLTIGRGSHCDIIVPNDYVSREHARISVVGGKYVFEDMSKHGSVVGGQFINASRMTIQPGTPILLAGKVPLNWNQVYAMLPLHGQQNYPQQPDLQPNPPYVQPVVPAQYTDYNKSIEIGWGILAFLIPIAGWIMYFCWKDETPKRASQANTIAWISFLLNIISFGIYL